MGALTALAIGQGIKSAYSFGKGQGWWGAQPPQRKQSEEERLYGAELKRRTKEGIYSKGTQLGIKNQALRGAYGMAQRGVSDIRTNLSRRGFEGSAIGAEAGKSLYSDAINKAGDVGADVRLQNEMSKINAYGQLAQYGAGESQRKYQNAMAKYNFKSQAYDAAVGGVGDMISNVGQQYLSQALSQRGEEFTQALADEASALSSKFRSFDDFSRFLITHGDKLQSPHIRALFDVVKKNHPEWF